MTIAHSAEGVLIWLASLAAIISCIVAIAEYYRRHDAALRRASSARTMVSTSRRTVFTHPLDIEILGGEGHVLQVPQRAHFWRPDTPAPPPPYENP